jgi:uncharacterized coiled-coil protein SlyX
MLEARLCRIEIDVRASRADIREIKDDLVEIGQRVVRLEQGFDRMERGLRSLQDRLGEMPTRRHLTLALASTVLVSGALAVCVAALFAGAAR